MKLVVKFLEKLNSLITLWFSGPFGNISKVSVFTTRSRLRITTLTISDDSGNVKAKWFGPQYIESRFKEGDSIALSGKPEIKKTGSIEFRGLLKNRAAE